MSVEEVVSDLRAAGPVLARRPWAAVAERLGSVGARFLDQADALRAEALRRLPDEAQLSPRMSEVVLDGMARDWTPERLVRLVHEELDDPGCLDGVCRVGDRALMAFGPRLCLQIVSGSVPGVGVNALLRSLLVKAPTLVKPGRGDVALTELFARGLQEADAELASALQVLYWPGDDEVSTRAALAHADVVTVYGSDRTVADVRAMAAPTARVVGYHHRIGVGLVGRDALGPGEAGADGDAAAVVEPGIDGLEARGGSAFVRAAEDAAGAIAIFEQRGCVCPHELYVEEGGARDAAAFAEALAGALASLASTLPSPPLSDAEGAALQQLRGTAELAAASGGGRVLHGGPAAPWTVIYEDRPMTDGPVTFGRSVRVRAIPDASELPAVLGSDARHLQSVGYAGLSGREKAFAEAMGRAGAARVVPFGRVSFPEPWWLHDGRGPLRELVRWVEVER